MTEKSHLRRAAASALRATARDAGAVARDKGFTSSSFAPAEGPAERRGPPGGRSEPGRRGGPAWRRRAAAGRALLQTGTAAVADGQVVRCGRAVAQEDPAADSPVVRGERGRPTVGGSPRDPTLPKSDDAASARSSGAERREAGFAGAIGIDATALERSKASRGPRCSERHATFSSA